MNQKTLTFLCMEFIMLRCICCWCTAVRLCTRWMKMRKKLLITVTNGTE